MKTYSSQIITLLLLCTLIINAQDTISYAAYQQNIKNKEQKNKDSLVLDTLKTDTTPTDIKQLNNTSILTKKTSAGLQDLAVAHQIDARWRAALIDMSLFDTITAARERTTANIAHSGLKINTDTLKSRLKALNAKTPFNIAYNPSLERVINSYLGRNKKALQQLMAQSVFYFPMFEEALAQYNIPLEIKYLAIVESALRPRARSRVGATGLWQFMYATGKMYNLEVNSYVDDRMDPIKATQAACKYLKKLHEIFDDWDLALAAYNSGPGNVSKAIRRSGGYTNYWNLRRYLPRETAGYVPSFLATMYFFEYASAHGFTTQKPQAQYWATDTVQIKNTITLPQVSEFTDTPLNELQYLNPQYKLDIIPVVKNNPYYLRLPLEKVGAFVNNEKQIYAFAKAEFDKREKPLPELTKLSSSIRYKVKNGDYLGKIANKFGVKVSQIRRWNNMKTDRIKVGKRLIIHPKKL